MYVCNTKLVWCSETVFRCVTEDVKEDDTQSMRLAWNETVSASAVQVLAKVYSS